MKLDPNIAEEVSQELGQRLPRPDDEAFEILLGRLETEKPTLAEKLRSGLIHQDLGDIESEARKHVTSESRGRDLRRALAMRYDELDGKWYLSKFKTLSWGSLFVLGIMAVLFMGAPMLSGGATAREGAEEAPPVVAQDEQEDVAMQPQDEDPFGGLPEELAQNDERSLSFANAQPLPQAEDSQEPSREAEEETESADEAPFAGAGPQNESPLLPGTAEEEELGLLAYSAEAEAGGVPQGLRAYGNGTGDNGAEQADPFDEAGQGGQGGGPVGLAAYSRAEPELEGAETGGLNAYQADASDSVDGLVIFEGQEQPLVAEADTPETTQVAQLAPPTPDSEVDQLMTSGVAFAQGDTENSAEDGDVQLSAEQLDKDAVQEAPYRVGDSVSATLQLGVVAVDGASLPVLARGEDGSVWQGQATLTPTGRVDIRFTEVWGRDRQYPVHAVAQAGDGYLGVPAEVTETTPALASDLARGALRGLSEYVQALGQQTEVRVEGNTPIISRDAPPLEASIAGSVARLFTPPEGEEQQALVRLAQIPAQTAVEIVVLSEQPAPTIQGN